MDQVMERSELLRPFEREILERYGRIGKGMGWKGFWIREFLQKYPYSDVYSMFSAWKLFCTTAEVHYGVKIKPGTYQAFRTYIGVLHKLGLIKREYVPIGYLECPFCHNEVRVYPTMLKRKEPGRIRPVGYDVVPERKGDTAWMRPLQVAYPSTDWTLKTAKEKRALREKYRRPAATEQEEGPREQP